MYKIIGLFLVKNEDVYIEQAILNVIDFCDKIIVEDNHSEDNTFSILENLAAIHPKIKISRIDNPLDSHRHIAKYYGTNTWIFGVDGDELYDKKGLVGLRQDLQNGKYNDQWILFGNILHCIEVDRKEGTAQGYLCPPSKSMTKLYNFSIIDEWSEITQRLHGFPDFKEGFHDQLRYPLYEEFVWENSPFRCLHAAFVKRSSLDKRPSGRITISEKNFFENNRDKNFLWKIPRYIKIHFSFFFFKGNKGKHYRKGKVTSKSIEAFFN